MTIDLRKETFDPGALLNAFQAQAAGAGAVVSFTGTVREACGEQTVTALELDAHPTFTAKELARIEAAARDRWPLVDVLIVHRHGRLSPGEPIVLVATAAAHRRAAFEAADFLMDHLKTDAPFWKREIGPDGSRWIEPRPEDRSDRARWQEPS